MNSASALTIAIGPVENSKSGMVCIKDRSTLLSMTGGNAGVCSHTAAFVVGN